MRKQTVIAYALVASAAIFVGCSSGGQQASVPATTTGAGTPTTSQGMSKATFTLTIPNGSSASATNRNPAFISSGTASMSIVVQQGTASPAAPVVTNLTSGSPGCTSGATSPITCTVTVAAPIGTDTFTVTLYSATNAGGSVLSSATLSGNVVVAATANSFPITLNGTVASIAVSVTNGNNLIPGGYATTLPVVVTAKDASGATIVGPGNYTNPITLTNADTSGSITTLSTTTVSSPATTVTLAYAPTDTNGGVLAINGLPAGATTIGASASGVSTVTPGTFQYIADRFFGFGHSRTLSGTGLVTTTNYSNGSPNPSATFSYSITDVVINHAPAVPSGAPAGTPPLVDNNHLWTYTQTAPGTIVETQTIDNYRRESLTATGSINNQYAKVIVGTFPGSTNTQSAITGNLAGTTQVSISWSPLEQFDVLPNTATTWSNSAVPFDQNWNGAMVASQTVNADGSWSFNESFPNVFNETQDAVGNAFNFNGSGPGVNPSNVGVTTRIATPKPAPSGTGLVIPIVRQTTSPSPVGSPAVFNAIDWYPSGGAPAPPLFTDNWTESTATIPGACNVPAAIGTQAFAVTQQQNQLRTAIFQYRQRTWVDYYVPGGIGFVCETYSESSSNYIFNGIISSTLTETYTVGVTGTANLSVRRKP